MRSSFGGIAVGGAIVAAALGLAVPASAEQLDGMYDITVVDGGGVVEDGGKQGAFVSPCGLDCARFVTSRWSTDARLQGENWVGLTNTGVTLVFDRASLAGTMIKGPSVLTVQLAKVG